MHAGILLDLLEVLVDLVGVRATGFSQDIHDPRHRAGSLVHHRPTAMLRPVEKVLPRFAGLHAAGFCTQQWAFRFAHSLTTARCGDRGEQIVTI